MPTGVQWASIAANGVTVVAAMGVFAKFAWKKFQNVVRKSVTAPLTTLQTTVDDRLETLQATVSELKTDLLDVKENAQRAHDRLDRHLESHGSHGTV